MNGAQLDISVVVPTYNQASMLRRLLDSFDKLTFQGSFEIILLDDCSPDTTGEVAAAWMREKHHFEARYIKLEKNGGPGRARNEGARAAHGRIIAYTDTDCVVTPNWLEMLVRKLDPAQNIVGIGGKVLPFSEDSMVARYCAFHKILEPPKEMNYLVTCNCCYLRDALLDAGGFDEDIPCPGGEDIGGSIRVWKRGGRYAYDADAVLYHDFNNSIKGFIKTWRNYGYGTGLVVHRLLTIQELYPEMADFNVDNYWYGRFVRPNVTGFRSFYYTLRFHLDQCKNAGLGPMGTAEIIFLWLLERSSYLRGWHKGVRQYKRELRMKGKAIQ